MLQERIARAQAAVDKAQARLAALLERSNRPPVVHKCRGCGSEIQVVGRGRPKVWCEPCRDGEPYKVWFRNKYREKWRMYQQNYRQSKKERLSEMDAATN
jgi:hypothetical protein